MRIARVPPSESHPAASGSLFPLGLLHPRESHHLDHPLTQSLPLSQQSTYDKLMAEVPKYKMITISILCDRLRITCSLARKAIAILLAKGEIKAVTMHSKQQIYTRATNDVDA